MTDKHRLRKLAKQVVNSTIQKEENLKIEKLNSYGYGAKSDFIKVTVTLPPPLFQKLVEESSRRKISRQPGQLSDVVRDALDQFFTQANE